MNFTTQSMQEILPILQQKLTVNDTVSFIVVNPDMRDDYAGTSIILNNIEYIYRSYKSWGDLAELLKCKILTPQEIGESFVKITYRKILINSFHNDKKDNEKYGINSTFSKIHKMEEPAFLYYYQEALQNVKVANRQHILNLGINRGDEFEVIRNYLDIKEYSNIEFVGVDHSTSAISYAKRLFPETNVTFFAKDINHLDNLNLEKFNLLISIGTLQSPSIEFKPFFMNLVQNYLKNDAAIILGFPNSRWVGGEMIYGAKAPNYVMSEQSLLFNDVMFCKKYLQQKKYRVTITGKQYVFLTATKIT